MKIEDQAEVHSYTYDALTRRITTVTTPKSSSSSSSSTSPPSSKRSYYYNNQWRVIEERDSTDTIDREYVYNPADRWNLIRRKYTKTTSLDTTHYILRDFLDPVAIVNTSGVVQERYGYEAFGAVRYMSKEFNDDRTSSLHEWNWLFHGEFLDTKTGLYNYGYRYYHPQLGKWPSRDPIGERGGINLYGMVGNDAVGKVDALGLCNPVWMNEGPYLLNSSLGAGQFGWGGVWFLFDEGFVSQFGKGPFVLLFRHSVYYNVKRCSGGASSEGESESYFKNEFFLNASGDVSRSNYRYETDDDRIGIPFQLLSTSNLSDRDLSRRERKNLKPTTETCGEIEVI